MKTEIAGIVRTWGLTKESRREYITVENTYGQARLIYKSEPYMAKNGKGEQRGIVPNHARMLRKEMEKGTFTPTPIHVGVRSRHIKSMKFANTEDGTRTVKLLLEPGDTLPLINGGHRFDVLGQIRKDAEERLKKASTDEEKKVAQDFLDIVDSQPITATVLLNGSTQDDFLNLQKGKSVDAAHMLSLTVSRSTDEDKDGPVLRLAFAIAKLMHAVPKNPFHRQIRFDSTGTALPISTLCSKWSSDLGTSLVGLAKVGMAFTPNKQPDWLACMPTAVIKTLEEKAKAVLEVGKVITPPPDGNKGSATMLIGVSTALAYRLCLVGEDTPSERTAAMLVSAANDTLDCGVNGNFSGPAKRRLIGEFVKELFSDLTEIEKHDGLPLGLVKTLSTSTFGASPLPKEKKRRGRPKKVQS